MFFLIRGDTKEHFKLVIFFSKSVTMSILHRRKSNILVLAFADVYSRVGWIVRSKVFSQWEALFGLSKALDRLIFIELGNAAERQTICEGEHWEKNYKNIISTFFQTIRIRFLIRVCSQQLFEILIVASYTEEPNKLVAGRWKAIIFGFYK